MGQKRFETLEEGIDYAKRYCSLQESCAKDVKSHLLKYGMTVQQSEKIIDLLIDENYINHDRYAQLYTVSKIRQSRWGKIKIKRMLLAKGIEASCINSAFEQIDMEEYRNVLQYLFEKKLKSLQVEDEYQKKYRLKYFLTSHGFENDLIEEIFNQNNLY